MILKSSWDNSAASLTKLDRVPSLYGTPRDQPPPMAGRHDAQFRQGLLPIHGEGSILFIGKGPPTLQPRDQLAAGKYVMQ